MRGWVEGSCRTRGAWIVRQFGYPRGFWGGVAGWIMALRSSNRARNRWAVELLDIRDGERVLEIGFGPGLAIGWAASKGGIVTGIDPSRVMLKQALRRNRRYVKAGLVDLRLERIEGLPDFSGSFDKILAVNSIQFWSQPFQRLQDLRRVLRPGGTIGIVFQPRWKGASDDDVRRAGLEICDLLSESGYRNARLEELKLKPVAAVCALATRPSEAGPGLG